MTDTQRQAEAEPRSYVFIGSSSEGYEAAEAVQVNLGDACEVAIWSQGVFGLSHGTLESLVLALVKFDFAVLVLTPDDVTVKRGAIGPSPRDNVVFEAGLFVGGLGQDRTFVVCEKGMEQELPTDLAGITVATFQRPEKGNMQDALGPACVRIRDSIKKLRLSDNSRLRGLSSATEKVESVGYRMERLLPQLARSKLHETEIFLEQFGPRLDGDKVHTLEQDMHGLRTLLAELEGTGKRKE